MLHPAVRRISQEGFYCLAQTFSISSPAIYRSLEVCLNKKIPAERKFQILGIVLKLVLFF